MGQLLFKIIQYYIDGRCSDNKDDEGEGGDDNDKFIVDDALEINIIHESIIKSVSLFKHTIDAMVQDWNKKHDLNSTWDLLSD